MTDHIAGPPCRACGSKNTKVLSSHSGTSQYGEDFDVDVFECQDCGVQDSD